MQNVQKIILTKSGLDSSIKDGNGNTLAHNAVLGGLESVQVLLGLDGIEWNEKNSDGNTPVLEAFKKGKYDVVKLLISVANVNTEIREH